MNKTPNIKELANKVEILAPAGDFSCLNAAIKSGANSVYLGIADFNMRATAARNFTKEDLPEIVTLCHKNNVKLFITVNTLLYNSELVKMQEIVDAIKEAGADGIIAADMATIQHARSKDISVQISTQLSISNTPTLKYYSQWADRVVLARELTIPQVKQISDDIRTQNITGPAGNPIELELFAHGALCVAVSGRCAMSLYSYGTSANRGKCTQICRRKYKITDVETGNELVVDNNYVMSPTDLSTIGMLPELIKAGANVLKLEGRGRPAEYVDTVVRCYREAIDSIADGSYTQEKIDAWKNQLKKVFNRGFSEGLYRGRSVKEWSGDSNSQAENTKIQVGRVEHYYPKAKVAHIKITAGVEVNKSDTFMIIGRNTGIVKGDISEIRIDNKIKKTAKQGDEITIPIKERVRKNDDVYIVKKAELNK